MAGAAAALKSSKLGVAAAMILLAAAAAVVVVAAAVSSVTDTAAANVASNNCNRGGSGSGDPSSIHYVSEQPSKDALADIPGNYLKAYQDAGKKYGLDWTIIAAIGKIESDHGRAESGCIEGPATAYGTAKGPMQFIDSTWATVGVDGNGDGQKNVCDYRDAIPATAGYLRDSGAPQDYSSAIYAYNHADWYVQEVFDQAQKYREAAGPTNSGQNLKASAVPQQRAVGPAANKDLAAVSAGPLSGSASALVSQVAGAPGAAGRFVQTRQANAESQGWDLVDYNHQLLYQDDTQYDSALNHAVDAWNALGSVKIAPSSSSSNTDVFVGDIYSMAAAGLTSTDKTITLNESIMNQGTQNAQDAIITHEFGHALGLEHVYNVPSVMYKPQVLNSNSNIENPTDDDKRVYYELWGKPTSSVPVSTNQGSPAGNGSQTGSKAVFPLPSQYAKGMTENWGDSRPQNAGYALTFHEGEDIMAPKGTPIYSIVSGTVVQNMGANSDGWDELGGWTLMVQADEDAGPIHKGDMLYYAHEQSLEHHPGDKVTAGEVIGHVGSSGQGPEGTTGQFEPHLHLGWYDVTGQRAERPSGAMNPWPMLQQLQQNGGSIQGVSAPGSCSPAAGDTSPAPGGGNAPPPTKQQQPTGNAQAVIEAAKKYLGTPYVTPGDSFDGIDCSGLTMRAYQAIGVQLPHWDDKQYDYGTPVDQSDLQPGDLVFFSEPGHPQGGPHGVTHVAIYYGNGDIIHASSYYGQVVISPMKYVQGYLGARRLVK